MGAGNNFVSLRGALLDAQGDVRKDIFKPKGDIHLNGLGTQIVSLRIRQLLEIMLPVPVPAPVQTPPAPVQTPAPAKHQRTRVQAPVQDPAPVAVNPPPVVGATLVADVVSTPVVVSQDQVESPMEVEDEDSILERLFFKKYGRALPEEKEKESDVDQINFVIDLTDDKNDSEEMEVATPVVVVKTEPIEIVNVSNVTNVKVADVADIPLVLDQINNVLTHTHRGIQDIRFETREDLLQRFEATQRSYVFSLGGVALIGLIVGGIGIMNVMLASINERVREIGVRRALGAKRRDILVQILAETITLALAGGLIGMLASIGLITLLQKVVVEANR
jgi:hypothetical protein